MNNVKEDNYPCYGHECYDRGNYHVSCVERPLHKRIGGLNMTNKERISKLCEAVVDLIDMIDKDNNLEWVRNEAMRVWEDILNE